MKATIETWISLEEEDSDDDNSEGDLIEEQKDDEDEKTDIESEEEIEEIFELFLRARHLCKGSRRVRNMQFFLTLFKRPLTPPPFV